MADIITKEEYEFYKSQDPKDLTQEELNWVNDYEKSEVNYPSKEDLEWARFIINEPRPYYQRLNKESGDWDKAQSILKQEKVAREVLQQKGNEFDVYEVKSTPEDVVKKGGFKFNWRDAYEQNKGEKLRATEADAKKLQDFINSNMYNVDDDIKLKQIAYNLHMYNPKTMKWSDFINSEQGNEFKNYLEDVRKAQTEKAVDNIWSGKDDKTAYDKFSTKAVDFMLPVSKEYARNHYNDEDFSLAGPLAVDAAANLVMAGPGVAETLPAKAATKVNKVMSRPAVSWLYGNVAAPAITETGNAVFNKESIPEAFVRTAEGTLINVGTPRILEGMLSSAGRGLPTIEGKRKVQKMIDEAANKAAKISDDIGKGKPYQFTTTYAFQDGVEKGKPYPLKIEVEDSPLEYAALTKNGETQFYSTDPTKSNAAKPTRHYKSVKDMPPEAVTADEMTQFYQGLPFLRGEDSDDKFVKILKLLQDYGSENIQDKLILKKAQALAKDGDLRSLSPSELRQLGFADKESFMNYLIRTIKMKSPSTLSSYLTNAAGRPEFGREAGPVEAFNRIFGTNFFMNKSKEDKQKSRIERILGIE